MNIHPYIENLLENYPSEQLYRLLLWLNSGPKNLAELSLLAETESQNPQNLSLNPKAESTMSTLIGSLSTHALPLEEQVAFSILNEFGPNVSGKSYFMWLKNDTTQRIASISA